MVVIYVDPTPITPGMFGYSILRAGENREFFTSMIKNMNKFDVPIEGLHTETGPGVYLYCFLLSLIVWPYRYEAAISFGKALEAADRAVLFKGSVKELGRNLGIIPSFMAKPSFDLPGCSGHLHQNLAYLKDNKNAFLDEYLSRY